MDAHPAAGCARPGENLAHGVHPRGRSAAHHLVEEHAGQRQRRGTHGHAQHAGHRSQVGDGHDPFVSGIGRSTAANIAIDDPPCAQCAQRSDGVRAGGELGHGDHREAALGLQIRGQPIQHEVERIVARKKPDCRTPERGLLEDHPKGRRFVLAWAYANRRAHLARHLIPRPQPQQRQPSENQKRRTPAEVRHQHAAGVGADRRADQVRKRHDPVGGAQTLCGHDRRHYLRHAREPGTLTQAEQQPQHQQTAERMRDADQHGGRRPDGEPGREYSMRAVALREPAHGNLQAGIRPEERRHERAHLGVVQMQIALHQVRGRRQGAAIDVVDEQHGRQQKHDRAARGPHRVNGP